jgi:hypothetical protein
MVHTFIIGENTDNLIIDFSPIIKFHNTDNPYLSDRSRNEWLRDSDDLYIEWITIFIPCAGDRPIGEWVRER